MPPPEATPRATIPPEPSHPLPTTSSRRQTCPPLPCRPVRSTESGSADGMSPPPPCRGPADRSSSCGPPHPHLSMLSRRGYRRVQAARPRVDAVGSRPVPRALPTISCARGPVHSLDPWLRVGRRGGASRRCPRRTRARSCREPSAGTTATPATRTPAVSRRTNRGEPPKERCARHPAGFGNPSRAGTRSRRLSTQGEVSQATVWLGGDARVKGAARGQRVRGYFFASLASLAFFTSASARLRVEVTAMSAA